MINFSTLMNAITRCTRITVSVELEQGFEVIVERQAKINISNTLIKEYKFYKVKEISSSGNVIYIIIAKI